MGIIKETKDLISYEIEETYGDASNDREQRIRLLSEATLNCARADAEERKVKHEIIRGYIDSGAKIVFSAVSTALAVITLKLSVEGKPIMGSFRDIFREFSSVLKK